MSDDTAYTEGLRIAAAESLREAITQYNRAYAKCLELGLSISVIPGVPSGRGFDRVPEKLKLDRSYISQAPKEY